MKAIVRAGLKRSCFRLNNYSSDFKLREGFNILSSISSFCKTNSGGDLKYYKELNYPIPSKLNNFNISKFYSYCTMEDQILLTNKEETLAFLKKNDVTIYHMEDHEKLMTVQAGLDLFQKVNFTQGDFVFCKNLFMKNKTGTLYLLTVNHVS